MNKLAVIGIMGLLLALQLVDFGESVPRYIPPKINIDKVEGVTISKEFETIIDQINDQNLGIRSISYNNASIKIANTPFRIRTNIDYKKNTLFRMISSSISGKELDIGMNEDMFWFWSKRIKPQALYYAKNEEINKTRLRSPFNPFWIKSCLGIDKIQKENVESSGKSGNYIFLKEFVSTAEGVVVKTVLIDPKLKKIIGNYLHRYNGEIIISTEVYKFKKIGNTLVPSEMETIWYEEDFSMKWDMKDCRLNVESPSVNFEIPNLKNKINMAEM